MINGLEPQLIEERDLRQLLGDADLVAVVHRPQRLARYLDELVVIHREVRTIAVRRAERRDTEHVGDEAEARAVPGPDQRAGTRQPLRFLVHIRLACELIRLILNQPVGPTDANRLRLLARPEIERQRSAVVHLLLIVRACLDLDLRSLGQLQILHASQRDPQPVRGRAPHGELLLIDVRISSPRQR